MRTGHTLILRISFLHYDILHDSLDIDTVLF